jgi:glycosyltransferase involved in cell wall biosynthesis
MPAFNCEPYLASAVESVMRQSFRDFEFIIVDDGSTDDSRKVLRRYSLTDSRVRLVTRPNTGLVAALAEMIDLARGEFLARMDADDICFPHRLAAQVAFLDDHPEVVCVGGGIEMIDERGRPVHRPLPLIGHDQIEGQALRGRVPLCHPSIVARAQAVRRVGGYDALAFPAEDLDLFLRLCRVGRLENVPDIVLQYRLHPGSVSVTRQERQLRAIRAVCERAAGERGIPCTIGSDEDLRSAIFPSLPGFDDVPEIVARNPSALALAWVGARRG